MIDPVQVESMIVDSVSQDEYRLKKLAFTPDVFYDIGANVGGVTLFAATLFPSTKIVAVEPEEENYRELVRQTEHLPNVVTIQAALAADKQVYRCPTSPGVGNWIFNSKSSLTYVKDWVLSDVPAVTLDELYAEHGGDRYVVKLDCESGEMMVVTHEPSRQMIANAEYLAGEFHLWGRTHDMLRDAMKEFMWWVYELQTTHNVDAEFRGGMAMLYATRRAPPGNQNDWEDVIHTQEKCKEGNP